MRLYSFYPSTFFSEFCPTLPETLYRIAEQTIGVYRKVPRLNGLRASEIAFTLVE